MKYLSSLLPVFLLTTCGQVMDQPAKKSAYQPFTDTKPDTISAATNAVLEMSKNSAKDPHNPDAYKTNENNKWRYDVPMPGNTYKDTLCFIKR